MRYEIELAELESLDPLEATTQLVALDTFLAPLYEIRFRLETLSGAQARVDSVISDTLDARDGETPAVGAPVDQWPVFRAPTGAHDAYPAGRVARWNNRLYRAKRSGVVHDPTAYPADWMDVTAEMTGVPDPVGPAPWQVDRVYVVGVEVTHEGFRWRCLVEHTSHTAWAPSVYTHAVWLDLGRV